MVVGLAWCLLGGGVDLTLLISLSAWDWVIPLIRVQRGELSFLVGFVSETGMATVRLFSSFRADLIASLMLRTFSVLDSVAVRFVDKDLGAWVSSPHGSL